MIGWQFPLNNAGQEDGPNDSGIETFLNDPLSSLAKEICQNSCDARDRALDSPVEVHFELEEWIPSEVPGVEELVSAIDACVDYWSDQRSGRKIFNRAQDVAAHSPIRVLKISDYNTTGLTGSGGREGRGTNWQNLVKAVGSSDKRSGELGSFGIGKHAPFACSTLRTVLYSTLDKEGINKFQGKSILATYESDNGNTTQGTGYFGILDGNREVVDVAEIPERFRRTTPGTDIYVLGFIDYDDWETRVLHSVLDSFFKAIYDELLVVRIAGRRVTATNLGEQLAELDAEPNFLSPQYYESITSEDTHVFIYEDFDELGRVELHLLPRPNFPKRIAMVRRSGMVVFHKGHFRTPVRFAGVLQTRGDGVDSFFQELEPPAHDRWEAERFDEDPDLARRRVKKLYGWINDCVKEMSGATEADEQDLPGLSNFLPDDMDDVETPFDENAIEEKSDEHLPTEMELNPRFRENAADAHTSTQTSDAGETDGGTGPGGEPWDGEGDEPNEDDGGTHVDGGTGGSGDNGDEADRPDESDGPSRSRPRAPISLVRPRCFCTDPDRGAYELVFTAPTDSNLYISLRSVGESETEFLPVLHASKRGLDEEITVERSGVIGPINVSAGSRYHLEATLPDHVRCALEISANED